MPLSENVNNSQILSFFAQWKERQCVWSKKAIERKQDLRPRLVWVSPLLCATLTTCYPASKAANGLMAKVDWPSSFDKGTEIYWNENNVFFFQPDFDRARVSNSCVCIILELRKQSEAQTLNDDEHNETSRCFQREHSVRVHLNVQWISVLIIPRRAQTLLYRVLVVRPEVQPLRTLLHRRNCFQDILQLLRLSSDTCSVTDENLWTISTLQHPYTEMTKCFLSAISHHEYVWSEDDVGLIDDVDITGTGALVARSRESLVCQVQRGPGECEVWTHCAVSTPRPAETWNHRAVVFRGLT